MMRCAFFPLAVIALATPGEAAEEDESPATPELPLVRPAPAALSAAENAVREEEATRRQALTWEVIPDLEKTLCNKLATWCDVLATPTPDDGALLIVDCAGHEYFALGRYEPSPKMTDALAALRPVLERHAASVSSLIVAGFVDRSHFKRRKVKAKAAAGSGKPPECVRYDELPRRGTNFEVLNLALSACRAAVVLERLKSGRELSGQAVGLGEEWLRIRERASAKSAAARGKGAKFAKKDDTHRDDARRVEIIVGIQASPESARESCSTPGNALACLEEASGAVHVDPTISNVVVSAGDPCAGWAASAGGWLGFENLVDPRTRERLCSALTALREEEARSCPQ